MAIRLAVVLWLIASTSYAGFNTFDTFGLFIDDGPIKSLPKVFLPLTSSLNGILNGILTFTRASTQWYQDDAGVWQSVGNDIPAFNSKGIFLEAASANEVTCYSALTESNGANFGSGTSLVIGRKYQIVAQATLDFTTQGAANNDPGTQFISTGTGTLGAGDTAFEVYNAIGTVATASSTTAIRGMTLLGEATATATIVDDTAALATAGFGNLSGRVVEINNTSSASGTATVRISGSVGNTNPHSLSVVAKTVSGAFTSLLRLSAGTGPVSLASSTYTRFISANVTPTGGTQLLDVVVSKGCKVRFVLPQLEELPFVTSPIVTAGATATRAANSLSASAANFLTNNISGSLDWTPTMTSVTSRWLWGSYADANNQLGVYRDGTAGTFVFRKRIGGVNYDVTYTLAVSAGTTYRIAWRMGPAGMDMWVNGVKATGNADATNAVLGSSIQIGADGNGANMGAPQIRNYRVWWAVLPDPIMATR